MYQYIALGGTFDHLHVGHQALLDFAFAHAEHVVIGLTLQPMVQEKSFSSSVFSFDQRKKELEQYLRATGKLGLYEIIPLSDVYGTTLQDTRIEAIAVTPQTYRGAENINKERMLRSMSALEVLICDLVLDETGKVISSTRIRAGEIDRQGFIYMSLFNKDLIFSKEALTELKHPLGELEQKPPLTLDLSLPVALIGDRVSEEFMKQRLPFTFAYGDEKTKRMHYPAAVEEEYVLTKTNLHNPAGTLHSEVVEHLVSHILNSRNDFYLIEGEEDLLTLPAICLLPLGSSVFYGHPYDQEGIVRVKVNETIKEKVKSLLLQLQ